MASGSSDWIHLVQSGVDPKQWLGIAAPKWFQLLQPLDQVHIDFWESCIGAHSQCWSQIFRVDALCMFQNRIGKSFRIDQPPNSSPPPCLPPNFCTCGLLADSIPA